MRKTLKDIFLGIMIMVGISSIVNAQNTERNGISAQINISATVIQSIELITVNSISFANSQPEQGIISINPVTDLNAGYMIAIGTPGTSFRLNYQPQIELTQVEGDGSLTFVYELSVNEDETQATSEILENNDRSLPFNAEGMYYIWVGGSVNITNAAPGNYNGDFTIEIDYI